MKFASTALAIALATTTTPASAQDANSSSSQGNADISNENSSSNSSNWAFNKEGNRLWQCAVEAADAAAAEPNKTTSRDTSHTDGKKIYLNNSRQGGPGYGANMGVMAVFDPKDETISFTSYVAKASDALAGPKDAIYSIKLKFNQNTDVIDARIPAEDADPQASKLVAKQSELAMLSFSACAIAPDLKP